MHKRCAISEQTSGHMSLCDSNSRNTEERSSEWKRKWRASRSYAGHITRANWTSNYATLELDFDMSQPASGLQVSRAGHK